MSAGRQIGDWRACVLEWDRRERRKEVRMKEKEEEKQKLEKGFDRDYTEEQFDGVYTNIDSVEF